MILIGLLAAALLAPQAPRAQRFDYLVRSDFFAGLAGDTARLDKEIEFCERTLADNPRHAEALVWHGAGLLVRAAMAFQKGDMAAGASQFQRSVDEMDRAVALAPDNPGVLIPRGATLLEATRGMGGDMARPLLESAVANYERALAVQASYWSTLGDHAKGELLFGLADGWARLGDTAKARAYFERLVADAPTSGQTSKASAWMKTGVVPKSDGAACVGCHK